MESFHYNSPPTEDSFVRSVDSLPQKIDLSYLTCNQKEIVTSALSAPNFIARFSQYDSKVFDQNAHIPSHESIVFEELCFAELAHTAQDNQTYLSPSESSSVLNTISRELKIPRPPIDSDGLLIEHDGRNSYLKRVCEYTLSNNLSNHKTAQMDRYLNKNNELEFLRRPESLTVFNHFLKHNRDDFPPDLIVDVSKVKPLLMLSYLATPNSTFPGVEVNYSSFPVSIVRKIAESIRSELKNGK